MAPPNWVHGVPIHPPPAYGNPTSAHGRLALGKPGTCGILHGPLVTPPTPTLSLPLSPATLPHPPSPHDASASLLGYLYQARYALLRGLEESRLHPGYLLSIEKFDDVAFEQDGRPVDLIQTKHHTRSADVSDYSRELWTTLNIWTTRLTDDPADAASTRFVLLTTATAPRGSALSMLRNSGEARDIPTALRLLIAAATSSDNQRTKVAREKFLDLTPSQRELLLHNMWVFDRAPNILDVRDDVEALLHYTAPRHQVANLVDHLEGWWFSRVITALSDSRLTELPLNHLAKKVAELRENFKLESLPLHEGIEEMLPRPDGSGEDMTLVRQMHLVSLEEMERTDALQDYYRAYEQRSRWARESLLLDGETERYDRNLRDAWQRRFYAETADLRDDTDEFTKRASGRAVFRWSREYQKPLRNRDELWLSSGSFQMLADRVKLGWHPNYEAHFAVLDEDDS